ALQHPHPFPTRRSSDLRRPNGSHESRTMLFPASRAQMTDVWRVIGLRGTASDSYSVSDLFVPKAYSMARDDASERRQPGALYCRSEEHTSELQSRFDLV